MTKSYILQLDSRYLDLPKAESHPLTLDLSWKERPVIIAEKQILFMELGAQVSIISIKGSAFFPSSTLLPRKADLNFCERLACEFVLGLGLQLGLNEVAANVYIHMYIGCDFLHWM